MPDWLQLVAVDFEAGASWDWLAPAGCDGVALCAGPGLTLALGLANSTASRAPRPLAVRRAE